MAVEWKKNGQAVWRYMQTRPCTGTPGYSGGCAGVYNDDYGSTQYCRECTGSGTIYSWAYRRVPEWDAPQPPKGWEPQSPQDIVDRLYNGT